MLLLLEGAPPAEGVEWEQTVEPGQGRMQEHERGTLEEVGCIRTMRTQELESDWRNTVQEGDHWSCRVVRRVDWNRLGKGWRQEEEELD